jgi:hydrogenase expression/formation protein HypD
VNEPYRDKAVVETIKGRIHDVYPGGTIKIMEVCGTHTMAIAKYGLRDLLPDGLSLISGPGCPVCVTPSSIINALLELAQRPNVTVATFGDMIRVPGSKKNLEQLKAEGADVRVIYSTYELLDMAASETGREFVFVSVGFETTTPGIALSILEAQNRGINNLYFITANRLVIPALEVLCLSDDARIDGFLCPGHVSVIIGWDAYRPIADRFNIPCVVGGFEPVDIMSAIYEIVRRISKGEAGVANTYKRAVSEKGNTRALEVIDRVFEPEDAAWRGIGVIPESGLKLRREFAHLDALKHFGVCLKETPDPKGCRCGDVLRGVLIPPECSLFGTRCTPEKPIGPCMVSSEGSCAAYYKYQ